jgi:ubiquinone/menaquinone biosynthesis C-methylase UbiE
LEEIETKLKSIEKCRICGSSKLTSILSLGEQYLASYTPKENDPKPFVDKAPLELIRCNRELDPNACGLVQLRHSVPPNMMYDRYFYRSGINQTMTDNLREIVQEAMLRVHLDKDDIVVDIGCNDGTLLKNYKEKNLRAVGFDPAKNMYQYSRESGANIIIDYFNAKSFSEHYGDEKAKIVSSIAMFYDLEDPKIFVEDVSKILHQEGVWVLELSYLPSMLLRNAFDTIVHEHLEYYHLSVIEYMLNKFGLKVDDAFLNDVNGGSFRLFIKHKEQSISKESEKRVLALREYEQKLGIDTDKPYQEFIKRCESERENALSFIKSETSKGKKIFAYGASTKGNTLLQYYGIDNQLIEAVADRNPDKWGRYTIGTNLRIISEEDARKANPDYFFVLPWHFITEFKEREKEFIKRGGKFIVPLPTFQVIDK